MIGFGLMSGELLFGTSTWTYEGWDGIVYQEGPVPARSGLYDATNSAKNFNYTHGTVVGGSGYLRVRVSPDEVNVDYVQTYLPGEEDASHKDGMVAHSYTIEAD